MYAFLTRVWPEANMNRWYLVLIQSDLFGETVLFRAWGNRANSGQQITIQTMPTVEEAAAAARRLVNDKVGKGYTIIDCAAELRSEDKGNNL